MSREHVRFMNGIGKVIPAYDLMWAFNYFGFERFGYLQGSPGDQSNEKHVRKDEYGRFVDRYSMGTDPQYSDALDIYIRPTAPDESDMKNTFVVSDEIQIDYRATPDDSEATLEILNWLRDNEWPTYVDGEAPAYFDWQTDIEDRLYRVE